MRGLYRRISRQRAKEKERVVDGEIGIFLEKSQWDKLRAQEYPGGLYALLQASEELGITPVWFTLPTKEQYDTGIITGALVRNGECTVDHFPFPKVVYDRATFPHKDRSAAAEFRNYLAQNGVKFVNTRSAFSKWGTYKLLSKDSELRSSIPKTIKFCRTFDLEELLQEFNRVYIKSNWGSRGKEVLALEKTPDRFYLTYPKGTTEEYTHFKDVTLAIFRFLGNKEAIAQEGIPLATWQGKIFDVRVLAQKIDRSQWACTGIALRLASEGKKTTNFSQGGTVIEPEDVLEDLWPGKSTEILKSVDEKCIKVCKILEERYGALGELGLDIGIDSEGSIWVIEVNGKPAKSTIRKLMHEDIIQLAYQRPLIYAQLLLEEGGT